MSDHKPSSASPGLTPRLLDALTSPWAIIPEKLLEIQAVYFTHLRGDKIDLAGFEAKAAAAQQPKTASKEKSYQVINGVAVIPVDGIIAKKMNLFTRISGGVSTQILQRDILAALADEDVTAIILDIDSPGGTVDGTEELADAIHAARGQKPVIAYTDGMMASAAYWIGAAAERIYISGDTPIVGSIGVVTAHVDYSKYEDQLGIKTTEIYAGKYKRIASDVLPLSQEGRQYLQDQVDYIYSIFAQRMTAYRPDRLDLPAEGAIPWADGKIFTGKQAITAGLVDGVSTLSRLIADISANPGAAILRARMEEQIQRRTQCLK